MTPQDNLVVQLDALVARHSHLSDELAGDLLRLRAGLVAAEAAADWPAYAGLALRVVAWVKVALDIYNGSDPP